MATYELKCPTNGTTTRTTEDPLLAKNTKCPDCEKPYLLRVVPKQELASEPAPPAPSVG